MNNVSNATNSASSSNSAAAVAVQNTISPVYGVVFHGQIDPENFNSHIVFYADPSVFRTARTMEMCQMLYNYGYNQMILTESEYVGHLINLNHGQFVIYDTSAPGFAPIPDGAYVASQLAAGMSVIIKTKMTHLDDVNVFLWSLNNSLAVQDISNMAVVLENTDLYYPRKRSHTDSPALATFKQLKSRLKNDRIPCVLVAGGPEEIPIEFVMNSGITMFGKIESEKNAAKLASTIDERLRTGNKYSTGISKMDHSDHYIYNESSAIRRGNAGPNGELVINNQTDTINLAAPFKIRDVKLQFDFDPYNPKEYKKIETPAQKKFDRELEEIRSRVEQEETINSKNKKTIIESAERIRALINGHTFSLRSKKPIANDNEGRATLPGKKDILIDREEGVTLLVKNNIPNARAVLSIARKITLSAPGKMKESSRCVNAKNLAKKILSNPELLEACQGGIRIKARIKNAGGHMSEYAYGMAYFHALNEDKVLAREYHTELEHMHRPVTWGDSWIQIFVNGVMNISAKTNKNASVEEQYKFIRNHWITYRATETKAVPLPKAA
jgi:hypothetical protein